MIFSHGDWGLPKRISAAIPIALPFPRISPSVARASVGIILILVQPLACSRWHSVVCVTQNLLQTCIIQGQLMQTRVYQVGTSQLSSRGLFLTGSLAAVHRHIGHLKPCPSAKMGIREIQVEVRISDVMPGAGGAAGPAHDVWHQPEVTVQRQCRFY